MMVLYPNKGDAMLKLSQLKRVSPLLCLAVMLLLINPVTFAQEKKQDLAKKYAVIVGDYEFDMTETEMGAVMTVNFYFEDGTLWALPETSAEPAKMEPVEGKTFEFTIEDPEEGTYEIKFAKDESGKYTKCQVKNEVMGFDLVGTKLKKSP